MTTLSQIRKNKEYNDKYINFLQKSYQNPHPISIISKIIKKENLKIINEIAGENNLDDSEKQELIKTFIKPNFYTPYIVNSETKESLQQLI